jgi:hypothetical protein
MEGYSNPGLLHVQALFIDGTDSHAQLGAHVRLAQHPLLGLPVTPFVLERADITEKNFEKLKFRHEALFRDQSGNVRIPPFTIGPQDEITINLPTGPDMLAIWAQIDVAPSGTFTPEARAYLRSVGQPDVPLGTRTGMPLAFSASGIVRIVLRGHGMVVGVRWLNAADRQKVLYQVVDVLNLPHSGGPRYAALNRWEALCNGRRDAQAPKRRPLQDTDRAPARASAPSFSRPEEQARVGAFFAELKSPLEDLITDATPQHQQVILRELIHDDGTNISKDGSGKIRIRALGLFLQAQADPGMASFCGYKTLDQDRIEARHQRLSLYRVTSFFRNPDDSVIREMRTQGDVFADLIDAAQRGSGLFMPQEISTQWLTLTKPFLDLRTIRARFQLEQLNCLAISGVAVADHHAALQPLPRPTFDTPEHQYWLPSDFENPRRVTETGLRNLVAGAGIAATRRQPPNGALWFPQNSAIHTASDTWRALILPNVPQAGPFSSSIPAGGLPESFLSDTNTGPERFRMYAAQMDRFGRFSEWGSVQGEEGPRPKPPRPVVRGSYRQPDTSAGSHIGRVTATVPLPEEESLAPGGYPLSHAQLTVTVEGAAFGNPMILPVSTTVSIHPDAPIVPEDPQLAPEVDRRAVETQFDGPSLPAMATRKMQITAIWIDTKGQPSAESEPLKLTMVDPYPPAQLSIPDSLLYAARPDATGKAWVERRWNAVGPGVDFAVYYTDENRLRDHLRQLATPFALTLLQTLKAEPDPAARATLLRTNQSMFPGFLFERLKEAVKKVEGTGQMEFRHALSGSLRVLSGYKIVAEAVATAARPDLTTVDTVFYGVPNSQPPNQPAITARQVLSEGLEPPLVVELTVTHRPGLTMAETARIRRTRSGVIDPIRNPVVATVVFGPPDPSTGLQAATYRDVGAAYIAPASRLQPFINYAWLAEAQGAPEPGSGATSEGAVAGLWSKPSAPNTLDVVPENSPDAPVLTDQRGTPQQGGGIAGLELAFTYPINLVPTSLGTWILTVERRLPGQAMTRMIEKPAEAGGQFTVPGDPNDPAFVVPSGTLYRVRVIDPLGRASVPLDTTT